MQREGDHMSDEDTVREEVDVDALAKEIRVPDLQELDLGDGGKTLVSMPEGGPDAVSTQDSTADAVELPGGDFTITAPEAEGAATDDSVQKDDTPEPTPVMTQSVVNEPESAPDEASNDGVDFSSMRKDELVAEAESRGIDTEGKTKAELLDELNG